MCLCALSLGRLQFSGKPEIGIARFRFPLSVYLSKILFRCLLFLAPYHKHPLKTMPRMPSSSDLALSLQSLLVNKI